MNIQEFDEFRLTDAVKFHKTLNPELFVDDHLDPLVRQQLLRIAEDFIDYLGISDLDVEDIRISGSNAAYTYTDHSDIDLHILVDFKKLAKSDVYRELFNSKKSMYNNDHNIKIHGYDVELYVQDSNDQIKSLGEYSVERNRWVKYPIKRLANLDQYSAREKFKKIAQLSELALRSDDIEQVKNVLSTLKKYRQAGLDKHGEFGPENLAYKALRSRGIIDSLFKHKDQLHSRNLSLDEEMDETEILEGASGYIPSNAEKNDPRFKTALTVDVKPDTLKKSAKQMGFKVSRAGIPPLLRK